MAGTGPTDPDPPDPERLIDIVSRASWAEYGLQVDGQMLFPVIVDNRWEVTPNRLVGMRITLNAFNLLRSASAAGGGTIKAGGIEFALLPVARGDASWAVASTT